MKTLFVIVILFSISIYVNAETNNNILASPNTESPDEGGGDLHHINFYGVLDIYETPAGALIITCLPPFLQKCFTLIWNSTNPNQKTVELNDGNQTQISVISGPSTTTGPNGEEIHTFTR